MELTKIDIGFPVLRLEVRIYYSMPRVPSAFERVLLDICERFGNNNSYNDISLESIFEDILGVPNPALLIEPTVRELVSLDALRCQWDTNPANMLTLRELEITERGRLMLSKGMLTAKSQENNEIFFYDPVRKKLLTSVTEQKKYVHQEQIVSLDASIFSKQFPEDLILSNILNKEDSTRKIDRIERLSVSVVWRENQGAIEIEGRGLQIVFNNPDQTAYINSLTPQDISQRFLEPVLIGDQYLVDRYSEFSVFHIEEKKDSSEKWVPLPQALDDFQAHERVWLVDSNSSLVACPHQANANQAIICFDQSLGADEIIVKWNEKRDGCILSVRGAYPLQDTVFASDQYVVRGRLVKFKVGRELLEYPIGLRIDNKSGDTGVDEILDNIISVLCDRHQKDDTLVPALWLSEPEFWSLQLKCMNSDAPSLKEGLIQLLQIRKRYIKLAGQITSQVWDDTIVKTVNEQLNSVNDLFTIDDVDEIVDSISQCEMISPSRIEKVVNAIVEHLSLPKTLPEFEQIATAVNKGGSAWTIPFPSPIYTSDVLCAIADEFPNTSLLNYLSSNNYFDKTIYQLIQVYGEINLAIGRKEVDEVANEDAYISLLKLPNLDEISALMEEWLNHYEVLCEKSRDIEDCKPDSSLATTHERIRGTVEKIRKQLDAPDPRFRSIFVLDTNALILKPRLLESVRADEFIYVPKRVIEELDGKKHDESLRTMVAAAHRSLKEFPEQQIKYCDGDMSVLSSDYENMKSDNLILSVAVKYRRYDPVLITNDHNLQVKAAAENISTMPVEEFVIRHS